jgi:hypothetical protein
MAGDWRIKLPTNATVLSADPGTGRCDTCGERRIIYQAHFFHEARIAAGCKACLTAQAGGPEKITARQIPELRGLPKLWERDARKEAGGQPFRTRRNDILDASGLEPVSEERGPK